MDTADRESHPFKNPLVQHAIGFSGAIVIIAVALTVVVADAAVIPKLLEYVVENDDCGETVAQM